MTKTYYFCDKGDGTARTWMPGAAAANKHARTCKCRSMKIWVTTKTGAQADATVIAEAVNAAMRRAKVPATIPGDGFVWNHPGSWDTMVVCDFRPKD